MEEKLTARIEKANGQKIVGVSSVEDYDTNGYIDLKLADGRIISFTDYTLYDKNGEVLEHTFKGIF